jgi:hypothetical protein
MSTWMGFDGLHAAARRALSGKTAAPTVLAAPSNKARRLNHDPRLLAAAASFEKLGKKLGKKMGM